MVHKIERSLKSRIIAVLNGQKALQSRNGKSGAYTTLKTLYKVLKAETSSEKAQIRGVLNFDYIKGKKTFDRAPIVNGIRSGAYRLHIEDVVETPLEISEGMAA